MWKEEKVINGHDTAVNCKRKENESCCFPTCSFILVIQICIFSFQFMAQIGRVTDG